MVQLVQRRAMSNTAHTGQLLRYGVVGACGYILSLSIYAGEIAAGVSAYAAVPAAFLANITFNFTFHRHWSFPRSGRPMRSEMKRFAMVVTACLTVAYTGLYLLHGVAGLPPVPAQALATLAAVPVGFLGNKLWSFRAL